MSLNTYSEIPNWLYLGKPVYTKEIVDSYSSIPNVQAYPVNELERSIPINVSSYASAPPVTRGAPPISYLANPTTAAHVRDIIPLSEGSHFIEVPSVKLNRYTDIFAEDILRTYTIYRKISHGFVSLGKLTKIRKSGVDANLYYFSEMGKTTPYRDGHILYYNPNEFVGKLSNASKLGGKKTRKNKRK